MGKSYRDLVAWQKAMRLTSDVYRITQKFPKIETYGMTSQMRRAAVSVPCNIAEGQGRRTDPEFHLFLGHARGSLMELETQILIAKDLSYIDERQSSELLNSCAEVGRIINGVMSSIKS